MSFCHAAFYGIGAYAAAILIKSYDFTFIEALVGSIVITGLIASIASIPVLRLKDDSLMLVTFTFAIIVYNLMLNLVSLTNGSLGIKGIPAPEIFGVNFLAKPYFLLLCLIFTVFTFWFFHKIVKSPYGTVIKGIRENKEVTENMGHNVSFYQHMVFIIGAAFAGLAGSLFATYISYIDPSLFVLASSVNVMIMIIFGGLGNLYGSVLGASILVIFPELLRFVGIPHSVMAESQQILYGLLLFLMIYFRPKGLVGEYKI